jgi:signal transduction histidine kinase
MRISLFVLLFIVCCHSLKAQLLGQARIDSMLALLPTAAEDTNKTKLLYRIGDAYNSVNPTESKKFALIGLEHARKMKFDKGIAAFYISLGNLLNDQASYDSAIYYFDQSYTLNKKIGNKKGQASALSNIGAAEQRRSNNTKAMTYIMQALTIADEIKDDYLLTILNGNLSDIYFTQENYPKAKETARRSLTIAENAGMIEHQANALTRLGNIAIVDKDTIAAIDYFKRSVVIYGQLDDPQGMATAYSSMSLIQRDPQESIATKLKAQELWDSVAPNYPIAITNVGNLGLSYFDLVRYHKGPGELSASTKADLLAKGKKYISRAVELSGEIGDPDNYSYYLRVLSELEQLQGDYKNAVIHLREGHNVYDSLYSQENKNKLAGIAGEREIALRDKEIELNKISMQAQRRQRIALIGGIALLAIIGGLLFWQNRTRRRTNTTLLLLNNQLDEANKVKARFFAIISHDLRSPVANLVNFLHLQREAPDLLDPSKTVARQQQITQAAEALLDNMEAMLLWSKSQMEQFKPQIREVPVQELFDELGRQFVSNTVSLRFSNPSGLLIQTDYDYLKTILYNLTANAIKALQGTSGAMVSWEARRDEKGIVLSITDNGPGTTKEQLDALYNEEAVISTRNGLGLHLIRELAKAIRCKISVASQSGTGTTFLLQLN